MSADQRPMPLTRVSKAIASSSSAGGQLSQAQLNGWGQIRELVIQLRGEAGQRQVANAARAMWASVGGDALILEGDAAGARGWRPSARNSVGKGESVYVRVDLGGCRTLKKKEIQKKVRST